MPGIVVVRVIKATGGHPRAIASSYIDRVSIRIAAIS
jgi:hypothetical protein